MRRFVLVAAVAALVLGVAASPALAKGPTEVTASGDWLGREITVDGHAEHASGSALGNVADAVRFYEAVGVMDYRGDLTVTDPPTDLGAVLVLRWGWPGVGLVAGPAVDDPQGKSIVQYVYPDAAGGPVVYVPAGQEAFGEETPRGWYAAAPDLVRILATASIGPEIDPPESTTTAPAVAAAPAPIATTAAPAQTPVASRTSPDRSSPLLLGVVVAGIVVAAAVGATVAWRRWGGTRRWNAGTSP